MFQGPATSIESTVASRGQSESSPVLALLFVIEDWVNTTELLRLRAAFSSSFLIVVQYQRLMMKKQRNHAFAEPDSYRATTKNATARVET